MKTSSSTLKTNKLTIKFPVVLHREDNHLWSHSLSSSERGYWGYCG